MKGNRRRDTKPELTIRRILHARGHRFQVDRPIPIGDRQVRPDIVFGPARVAVFVDGCFWHGCPEHGTMPRRNADYWGPKLARNIERDRSTEAALTENGWLVIRVWEHEDPLQAALRIGSAVTARRSHG
jgi:DNA mismatch endonuclease (patch repair protein)